MLRFRGQLPFDPTLYSETVTVYHREGLTRQVLEGVHWEKTQNRTVENGITQDREAFLLVIPYDTAPDIGDKLWEGIGPEAAWGDVNAPTVATRKRRTFRGKFSHWEVRG